MKNIRIKFLIYFILTYVAFAAAQSSKTAIFNSNFRTLKVQNNADFLAPPVIRLDSDDSLTISFDEIAEDASMLRAKLVHCNADWSPSNLVDSEFINTFNEIKIDDFAFSQATVVHYVNYCITIPSDDFRPTRSGNYLLQVFNEDYPDDIILQARFIVSEQIIDLKANASSQTDRGYNSEFIALEMMLDASLPDIMNPYYDLIITVTPDGADDETITLINPQRVEGSKVFYAHNPLLIFPAGKEWRRFETIRADFPGLHADSVRSIGHIYHTFLTTDFPRAGKAYDFDRTQFGRFLIREYNSSDSSIGADYVVVNFALDYQPTQDEEVFLDGEFARTFDFSPYSLKLYPDPLSGLLKAAIPLKQGAYNYRYVSKFNNGSPASPTKIDGNSFETSKEFTITVYLHRSTDRADRVLGVFNIFYNR